MLELMIRISEDLTRLGMTVPRDFVPSTFLKQLPSARSVESRFWKGRAPIAMQLHNESKLGKTFPWGNQRRFPSWRRRRDVSRKAQKHMTNYCVTKSDTSVGCALGMYFLVWDKLQELICQRIRTCVCRSCQSRQNEYYESRSSCS